MPLKSNFKVDLAKEKRLATLLDSYYQKHLRLYTVERVHNIKAQLLGVDAVFTNKESGATFIIDEKAQLDYVNERLPTFAFELLYCKKDIEKIGWLFDSDKKTDFYSLVTSIFSDETDVYTSCNITFINRKKLVSFLEKRGLHFSFFEELVSKNQNHHGKMVLEHLDPLTEGYLYFSTKNKVEKPINLILKLDFICRMGIGKRFV